MITAETVMVGMAIRAMEMMWLNVELCLKKLCSKIIIITSKKDIERRNLARLKSVLIYWFDFRLAEAVLLVS